RDQRGVDAAVERETAAHGAHVVRRAHRAQDLAAEVRLRVGLPVEAVVEVDLGDRRPDVRAQEIEERAPVEPGAQLAAALRLPPTPPARPIFTDTVTRPDSSGWPAALRR